MTKKTVVIDLEAVNAVTGTARAILKSVTEGIHYDAMNIVYSGRQTGKSMLALKVLKNRIYDANLCKEIFLPMYPEPKYKFSRATWYSSKLKGTGMWRLGHEYNEMIAWCTEQFGKHPKRQDAWSRWWVGIDDINFRDERDLVLYQLKWS